MGTCVIWYVMLSKFQISQVNSVTILAAEYYLQENTYLLAIIIICSSCGEL